MTKVTVYTPDEIISSLGETGAYARTEIEKTETTATYECYANWEIGQAAAHKTGYIRWKETAEIEDGEYIQEIDREILEFAED